LLCVSVSSLRSRGSAGREKMGRAEKDNRAEEDGQGGSADGRGEAGGDAWRRCIFAGGVGAGEAEGRAGLFFCLVRLFLCVLSFSLFRGLFALGALALRTCARCLRVLFAAARSRLPLGRGSRGRGWARFWGGGEKAVRSGGGLGATAFQAGLSGCCRALGRRWGGGAAGAAVIGAWQAGPSCLSGFCVRRASLDWAGPGRAQLGRCLLWCCLSLSLTAPVGPCCRCCL
jgi:hypothetical protein